ncbi:MAG: NCS1 family nucleobase:cation symporter-1 [Gammaproteobacteria bacterium]
MMGEPAKSRTVRVGEFYELEVGADLAASARFNKDIAPTRVAQRSWNAWHITALWVGMAICVPTYTLGGVLTTYFGLSVGEALWAIFIANVIVLIPLILNAFGGTKFGIPFPVMLRSSFGIIGSNVPALIRALVACGWFGIQTLFGGIAVHLLLSAISDSWAQLGGVGEVLGFLIFWVANVWVVIRGSESIKHLEAFAAPLLLLVGAGLLWWAWPQASVSELLARPGNRPPDAPLPGYFFAGLTAMVGFWATLSLNIPDFSRFARSQKSQIIGQIIGLPLTMLLFAGLGVVMTAASAELVGETVSDPINLIGRIDSPFWVVVSMIIIIVATISTNTAANIVSPTNDFQNVAPRLIGQKQGVLLTGFIGLALMSWELFKRMGWLESGVSVDSLYSNWLIGYSSLLGPIAGIMVVDYFIVRRQHYDLPGLYLDQGPYPAWNFAGFVAFLVPVALTLVAITTGALQWFYTYGWFTGSLLGGTIYYLSSRWSLQKSAVAQSLESRA